MAKKIKFVQTDFTVGELDPRMKARTDIPAYSAGCKKLRNALLTSQGSVFRRPGTIHWDELTGTTTHARVEPFVFNETQEYLFLFQIGKIVVYDVASQTPISTISTYTDGSTTPAIPIDATNIHEFTYAQQADTFIFTHESFNPIIVERVSSSSFTAKKLEFKKSSNVTQFTYTGNGGTVDLYEIYQPYSKLASSDVTIKPSSNIGDISLLASDSFFTSSMATNKESILWHGKEIEIHTVVDSTQANGIVKDRLEIELPLNPFRSTAGENTVEVTLVNHGFKAGETLSLTGFAGEPGLIQRSGLNGNFQIQRVIDDDHFMIGSDTTINISQGVGNFGFFLPSGSTYNVATGFSVGSNAISAWAVYNSSHEVTGYTGTSANIDPNGNGSRDFGGAGVKITGANLPASREWKEQSFCSRNGYPRAITFHQNRLWFGGTTSQPDALFGSQSGDYYNFDVGAAADNDSVQTIVASNQLNEIYHIVSNKGLEILTSGGEFLVIQDAGTPLTPTNIQIERMTGYGSTRTNPHICNGNTFYVQRNGRTVRDLERVSAGAFAPRDVSIRSSHLINTPIDICSFGGSDTRPEEYIFFINTDGTVAVLHSVLSESILGWVLWDASGQTPSTDGHLDKVMSMCAVNENIFWVTDRNGGISLEKFTNFDEVDSTNECHLDDAYEVTVANNTIIGIPAHHYNKTVHVIKNDGSYRGTQTVSGTGTLDSNLLNLSNGDKAYIGYSYFMNLETMPVDFQYPGSELTGNMRRITRVKVETEGALSMSVNGRTLFNRTTASGLIQQDPARVDGKQDFRLLGYSQDPTIQITQTLPASCGVMQLVSEVTV
tara:strand:- start:26732 stop:29227 length:2496 start_codon:yes stop_codon:yes gene_type:complete